MLTPGGSFLARRPWYIRRVSGARSRRFRQGLAPAARRLNASVAFDWRLLPHDVQGSRAHARMLAAQGIIAGHEAETIDRGLTDIGSTLRPGDLDGDLEDVHMNVEAQLTANIGEAGARLHTGRSRNDQVATDLKLYCRAQCDALHAATRELRRVLVTRARQHVDTLVPGYTHLQRAQPVTLAHHLLAYVAMFGRDAGRIDDARRRMNECPLGAGALAGTTLPLDRDKVAQDLGFDGPTRNSLDTVGDRDFAIELVAACAVCQMHLSRLGEELVLWATSEFGFVRLPEDYCSGSSLMPQKMNPDIPELVRAKAGRTTGALVTLLTVCKGLPLAYNKDLQETQEPLYDAVETVLASLEVMTGVLEGATFETSAMQKAVDRGHLVATELADYLVDKGVAFRRAHDVAGALVARAASMNLELGELSVVDLQKEASEFGPDVAAWLDPRRAVNRRDLPGGPARAQVLHELERLDAELATARTED